MCHVGCVVAAGGDSDGNGGALFVLLLPLMVVAALVALGGRSRRRRSLNEVPASRPSTAMLRAELSVLADDIMRFEPRVAMCEAARDHSQLATHRYRVAQTALDESPDVVDLVRVQRVVDEGVVVDGSRARAFIQGRTPPEPPPRLQRPGAHGEPAIGWTMRTIRATSIRHLLLVRLVRRGRGTLQRLTARYDARRFRRLGRRGRRPGRCPRQRIRRLVSESPT